MHTQSALGSYAPILPLPSETAPLANRAVRAVQNVTASSAQFHIPVQIQLLDGEKELIPAEICRVNAGFLRLAVFVPIEANRSLEVLYAGRRILCEVAYCERQQHKILEYHIGAQMIRGGGIRTERRLPVDLPATLEYPGAHGRPVAARVIDISQSGLGLELPILIPAGTLVLIDLGYGIAFGEIRHCAKKTSHVYRAGFQLDEFISRDGAQSNVTAKRAFDCSVLRMFLRLSKRIAAAFSIN
jgi:hypothetical protein